MGVFDLLFGFNGRITRSQFWLGQIALIGLVVLVLMIWAIGLAGTVGPDFQNFPQRQQNEAALSVVTGLAVAVIVTTILICWIGTALAIKRLHDRGKSGWSTLTYATPGIVSAIAPLGIFLLISVAVNVWFFIELGFLKGDDGANAYGPGAVADAGALVSREIAELQLAAQAKEPQPQPTPATPLPGKPSGVIKTRASRPASTDRHTGFGRRSPRIA